MGRKRFYVMAPSNAEIMNWHRQGQMQIEIPSRPPTDVSLTTERMNLKQDMEDMYGWAFGEDWRMNTDWDRLKLFVGTKRAYFQKNIGLLEIVTKEWWWTLNNIETNEHLVKTVHQIWEYFKNKGASQSIKLAMKENYEETVLHSANKI